MNRREFVINSGIIITASALSSKLFATEIKKIECKTDKAAERSNPDCYRQPIIKAIAYGINAPNSHNTQAWKFKIINDYEALLYVDEKRLLPAADPIARQMHIGCGCFLAVMKSGITMSGYRAVVDYLPEGAYSYKEIGTKPVARIKIEKSDEKSKIADMVFKRQTNRTIYTEHIISDDKFKDILNLLDEKKANVRLVNDKQQLDILLPLLYKGMEVECYDYDVYEETRRWFRLKKDVENMRDGLCLKANGIGGVKLWFVENFANVTKPDNWHNDDGISTFLNMHKKAVMSSKGLVIFETDKNEMLDWIKAGEDYASFQMAAAKLDYVIHPVSQVLQEYKSMEELYKEFNRYLKVEEPRKVQMVARIGKADSNFISYRRKVEDFIIPESLQ